MSEPKDPRWPKILSHSVHEFRTPMTVVSGYIGMLLRERAGAITDQQRRLLEEAAKSCARLDALIAEVSVLSNLEAGTLPYNHQQIDLRGVVGAAAAQLPPLPDREVPVEIELREGPATIQGDPVRLGQAFTAVLAALRREIITAEPLIVREAAPGDGSHGFEFDIGDPSALAAMRDDPERPVFNAWRGGVGLSLEIARRLIEAHGGTLHGAPGARTAGARIVIPG